MRTFIMLPLLALAACQVSKDNDNGTISAEFNGDVAENAARDVATGAEKLGGAIVNEAEETAAKIDNTDVDVDVDVNANTGGNAN